MQTRQPMLNSPYWGLLLCLHGAMGPSTLGIEFSGETMGTTFNVRAAVDGPLDESTISEEIERRLAEIDLRMSTYRIDSEISRFNRAPAHTWFAVSAETAEVVAAALDISKLTGGAFDPTVGPAVELWNFGARPQKTTFELPIKRQLQDVRQRVGFQLLQVRTSPPALSKSVADLEVDLSAIAKGHAVDALGEILEHHGIGNYLVEIGGEIRAKGRRDDGRRWRIGIESPTPNERRLETVIALVDQAMASSGNYRRFFKHEGITYSHTIDPHTAQPVRHQLAAVTIINDSARRADALATAVLVMGPEAGRAWCVEHQLKALLLTRHGDAIATWQSSSFPATLSEPVNSTNSTPQAKGAQLAVVSTTCVGLTILVISLAILLNRRRIQADEAQ